jgi:hypothetical protein
VEVEVESEAQLGLEIPLELMLEQTALIKQDRPAALAETAEQILEQVVAVDSKRHQLAETVVLELLL